MPVTYTKDDVMKVIEHEIATSSLREVARSKGLSASHLCDLRMGRAAISKAIARAFGFERFETVIVTFRKAA